MYPSIDGADGQTSQANAANQTMADAEEEELPVAVAVDVQPALGGSGMGGEAVAVYASPSPALSAPSPAARPAPVVPGAWLVTESARKMRRYSRVQSAVGVVSVILWMINYADFYNLALIVLGVAMIYAGALGYSVSSETGLAMDVFNRAALLHRHWVASGIAHFGTGAVSSLGIALIFMSDSETSEPVPGGLIVASILLPPAYFFSGMYVLITMRPLRDHLRLSTSTRGALRA